MSTDVTTTGDPRDDQYWYCEKHHRVEQYKNVDSTNRIGPFATYDEAAHALQTIAERQKRYDEEDDS